MNISRLPINSLKLPDIHQLTHSLSKNRRRRDRDNALLRNRLEAEKHAQNVLDELDMPQLDPESEEDYIEEPQDVSSYEDYIMLAHQCPTLFCPGCLEETSYAGMKNYTCNNINCTFKISGFATNVSLESLCDKLRDTFILHYNTGCNQQLTPAIELIEGNELLFLLCNCGFTQWTV